MDIYLTSNRQNQRIQFPLNPERITANTGARILSFETIELGEIAIPKGKKIARVSFDGTFPGSARQALGIVKVWTPPAELISWLQRWRDDGELLRFLVTETPLNMDVYIDVFEHSYAGGHGDVFFRLELVQARTFAVYTDKEYPPVALASSGIRPTAGTPSTYMVKPGDNLWMIAKRTLQDGSRWREIYNANVDVIGRNPDLIYPGQVLQIPGGSGASE